MRSLPLLAALTLVLASCSGVEAEDVVLPGRETLVSRYGSLAPGTFRVRQPSIRLDVEGMDIRLSNTISSIDIYSNEKDLDIGVISSAIWRGEAGTFSWGGPYNGDPASSRSCSGPLYIIESTATLLRVVFAGSCGKVGALRGPHDFTLVEGGFAYRR